MPTLSKKAVFQMIGERVSWCLCTRGTVIHFCAVHTELLSYWSSRWRYFRVLENKIRCQVSIDNMLFGSMSGKGTTNAIFHHAASTRKTPSKEEEVVLCFWGFGKCIIGRDLREVRWSLRKLGVDEWLIGIVMALYTEVCTIVKTDAGQSESLMWRLACI